MSIIEEPFCRVGNGADWWRVLSFFLSSNPPLLASTGFQSIFRGVDFKTSRKYKNNCLKRKTIKPNVVKTNLFAFYH